MQTLPETRQGRLVPPPSSQLRQRSAKQSLVKAFRSFTNAAGSLESSYSLLQTEVARLRRELERANQDLNQSLEDNKRIRAYLSRTLECLPCAVLVVDEDHTLLLEPYLPRLVVLSPAEIPATVTIQSVGVLR
jgi:flagellar biosynthesis component FlhA